MRIWTNGARHILFDERGLHLLEGGLVRHIEDFTSRECDPDVFSVSPSGETIWLKAPSGQALKLEIDDEPTVVEFDWEPNDVLALTDQDVIAVVDNDEPAGRIVRGRPPLEAYQTWQSRFGLTEPSNVEWDDELLDRQTLQFAKTGLAESPSDLKLHMSFYGIAVVDQRTGLIGRIPSYGEEVDTTWRVPTTFEGSLQGLCSNKGILVAHQFAGEEGVISHFDEHGRCLDRRSFWNLCSVQLLDGDRALVLAAPGFDQPGLEAQILSLGTMATVGRQPLHFDGFPSEVRSFVDRDRRHCILIGPSYAQVGAMEHNQWLIQRENFLTQFEESLPAEEVDAPNYHPAQARGATRINFPVIDDAPRAWTFKRAEAVRIPVEFRSAGPPGEGLRVEVSGDAIKNGLFTPEFATMDGSQAEFHASADDAHRFVARLEDIELPQGLEYPLDPKPRKKYREYAHGLLADTHRAVEVVGHANQTDQALLRLEVAALDQASPISWMRPLTVVEDLD